MPRKMIVGGRLFDGRESHYQDGAAILLEDGLIAAVGRRADFGQATGVELVDASGLYVLPGLVNAHVHLTFMYSVGNVDQNISKSAPDCTIHAVRVAALLLSQGITTARDMAGTNNVPLLIRDAIEDGRIPGPRLLVCNQPVAISGGHAWHFCTIADGPDAFRAAARQQLQLGADFIKVMASHDPWPMPGSEQTRAELTVEEMAAAFEVAHAWGRRTGCHVMGSSAIDRVIRAGVDIIEHGQYLTRSLAKDMAERGVCFTPTMSSYDVQTMHPRFDRGLPWKLAHEPLIEPHREALRFALEEGVKIVNGTDSVGCYAEEIDIFRRTGMSAADSLLSCTRWPAEALGVADSVGTLEVGKRGDLVLLREDPLADPYALEAVELVFKDGRAHRPKDLTYAEHITKPEWDMRALAQHAIPLEGASIVG